MASNQIPLASPVIVDAAALGQLLSSLQRRGYHLLGPTLRDGAIVYDPIESLADLPAGWTADQEAGRYRLRQHQRVDRRWRSVVLTPLARCLPKAPGPGAQYPGLPSALRRERQLFVDALDDQVDEGVVGSVGHDFGEHSRRDRNLTPLVAGTDEDGTGLRVAVRDGRDSPGIQ